VGRPRGACGDATVESSARRAFQSTARRTRRAAGDTFAPGEASRRNATASEDTLATLPGQNASTRWMPAGSTSPVGTATSYLAAEVQSSPPRRPREGATGTEPAQFKSKRHPGCQLAITSPAADDPADDAPRHEGGSRRPSPSPSDQRNSGYPRKPERSGGFVGFNTKLGSCVQCGRSKQHQ